MLDIRLVWLLTFLKIIIPSQEMLLKVMGTIQITLVLIRNILLKKKPKPKTHSQI